jgi:hypothetical protein
LKISSKREGRLEAKDLEPPPCDPETEPLTEEAWFGELFDNPYSFVLRALDGEL